MPIARKHLLPDPLFFRCIFSGRSRFDNDFAIEQGRCNAQLFERHGDGAKALGDVARCTPTRRDDLCAGCDLPLFSSSTKCVCQDCAYLGGGTCGSSTSATGSALECLLFTLGQLNAWGHWPEYWPPTWHSTNPVLPPAMAVGEMTSKSVRD